MIHNRKFPRVLADQDKMLSFEQASHSNRTRLDLSRHDETHLEKLGFAIDALNRWTAFVQSVEQIEGLIQRYENSTRLLSCISQRRHSRHRAIYVEVRSFVEMKDFA